jgi:hypothetical protein
MHTKDIKKREVLDFKQFLKVVNDPWNSKNFNKEVKNRSPFHKIKPEQPYDYVGYKDGVFNQTSKIDYPGKGSQESGMASNMGDATE